MCHGPKGLIIPSPRSDTEDQPISIDMWEVTFISLSQLGIPFNLNIDSLISYFVGCFAWPSVLCSPFLFSHLYISLLAVILTIWLDTSILYTSLLVI